LTSYYTGMRLGEVLGLKRYQVHLHRRMMFLTPVDCMSSAEVGILGGRISGEFQPQIMVLGCFGLSPYAA